MPQPTLPLELHQLIIDVLGRQRAIAFKLYKTLDRNVQLALRSFSLVCKAWHALTLRHTFYGVRIVMFNDDNQDRDGRLRAQLLQLMEVNPLIKECIQNVDLYIAGPLPAETVEALCCAFGPVNTLRVNMVKAFQPKVACPSSFDGVHPLLTHHLLNLTIRSDYLPTCLLALPPNIKSLTLVATDDGVIRHDFGNGHAGTWRSSTKLEKLVVKPAARVLATIAAAVDDDLSAFFDHIKYLDMTFYDADLTVNSRSWHVIPSRWTHLETLIVRFEILGKPTSTLCLLMMLIRSGPLLTEPGKDFLATCQTIPWTSFQSLHSLFCSVYYRKPPAGRLFHPKTDCSTLFLAGPSRLPRLQDLRVTHDAAALFLDKEQLCASLDDIYLHDINRTIENPNAFPSLERFETKFKFAVKRSGSLTLKHDEAVQLVMERLSAVFDVGGRRETRGWVTMTKISQTRISGV